MKVAKQAKQSRPKKNLSKEEIAAAIEGVLQPRIKPGDPSQGSPNPVVHSEHSNENPLGITTGLPIFGFWAYFFPKNERAPKEEKLTDEEITELFRAEFPGRIRPVHDNIASIRQNYNKGQFTKWTRPKIQSHRFDSEGNVILSQRRLKDSDSSVSVPARKMPETKTTDDKARVILSKKFANRTVIVEEVSDTEVLIKLARVIPEREAWLYANPQALASVRRGLAQARAGEVVPGPNLESDAEFVAQLED